LESKDQLFEHFRLLALRLNNEHPNCLKAIRSDNGTEFRNVSFDEFCLEHGIDQQFSAPRVPQQNRVVERKNRCNTKKILERGSGVDRKFDFLNRCSDGRSETADLKISLKRDRFIIHMLDLAVGWITYE
jgi:transposase InsO family protein